MQNDLPLSKIHWISGKNGTCAWTPNNELRLPRYLDFGKSWNSRQCNLGLGTWAYVPGNRVMQLRRYLGLGTWERESLEIRVIQLLRYLG